MAAMPSGQSRNILTTILLQLEHFRIQGTDYGDNHIQYRH